MTRRGFQHLRHRRHQRLGQTGLHGLALGQALAQVGAQAAQGGDAGDDAGLFGEGGSGTGKANTTSRDTFFIELLVPDAFTA